jgi:hypothetical protein
VNKYLHEETVLKKRERKYAKRERKSWHEKKECIYFKNKFYMIEKVGEIVLIALAQVFHQHRRQVLFAIFA